MSCRVHTTAQELPMKRVALQVSITSCLPHPATLTTLNLAPQHGFRLDASAPTPPLLPLHLSPGSAASAVFFLTNKPIGRSSSRSNLLRGGAGAACNLELQYQVPLHTDTSIHSCTVSFMYVCTSSLLAGSVIFHARRHPFMHALSHPLAA